MPNRVFDLPQKPQENANKHVLLRLLWLRTAVKSKGLSSWAQREIFRDKLPATNAQRQAPLRLFLAVSNGGACALWPVVLIFGCDFPNRSFIHLRTFGRQVVAQRSFDARRSASSTRYAVRGTSASSNSDKPCARNPFWPSRQSLRFAERAKRHLPRRLQLLLAIEDFDCAGRKV